MKTIFLLLALQAIPAQARWLTIQEAGSVIEKFHVDYNVKKNGTWKQTFTYVVRVQSEEAKSNSSLFPIEYNSATDTVQVLEAYTQNGKQKIKVDPSAIEDRDKGESKDYDVQRVRSVVFPQVQIGSRLFISYTVETNKPLIEDRWSTQVALPPGYHVESFRMNVKAEMPIYFDVQDSRGLISVKQVSPKQIEAKNRKTLHGWVHAEKDPAFHPGSITEIWISSHKDWGTFFAGLGKDYENIQAAGVPAKLKPWVAEASKKKSNVDKINFLMEKISRDFRYFGDWRRHNGGLVPRTLQEIEKSRYGDCKDLSSLLTSLLRALKMDARVALIRRGENEWGAEPDYKLPAVNRFNHAIVNVKDGDKTYWLDPTNPVMSLQAYPDISGRPAWLMSETGRFERLPEDKPEQFEHLHNYEYSFKDEDTVKVKVEAHLNDLAAYSISNDLMMSPKSDVLSETLEYFSEGQEVKSHKYIKEPQTGRILKDMKVVLEYEAGRVAFTAGKAAFWVIPDGFLQGSFYETADRESDIQLAGEPYVFKGIRRLKDTRLAQDTPAPCLVDSKWMKLERMIQVEGQDVVITQNVTLKKPFITREEFRGDDFKRLQADTKKCFYRSGVLIEPQRNGQKSKLSSLAQ